MEPGLRGREDPDGTQTAVPYISGPLWSPAFGAGKTLERLVTDGFGDVAAMEPGLRGREDAREGQGAGGAGGEPLWSPAFGAGKTWW